MNTSIQHPEPNGIVQPLGNSSRREAALSAWRSPSAPFVSVALFAGLLFLLLSAPAARADRNPPGCLGSGLGISLFTSLPDVHIGDTIYYSVNVFNAPFPACNAGETNAATAGAIYAFIVTPDGVTNNIILRRTFLAPGDSDLYTNVVSYVVRAQDIRPDGTIRATAIDQGDIHQNDVNSSGGGNQGVNTQVNLPCVLIAAQCVGSVGENGAITFTGTVTNCGNNTLVGVTVTNFNDNGFFTVLFPTNLAFGEVASFSGSWVPANPCMPSTAILTVLATDQFTSTPRTLTNFTTITCQSTLTPGINVTKACPAQPVSPGQLLTYSGSVSNTGNVTLTNIVVVDSQPAANTPVFTLASLAPGAVANFTGSYTAPTNCSVSDTLTATASSRCGVGVSSIASVTCPILTAPQIAVAVSCPATPAVPGGTLTYSGNVRNVGNTILTGIVVVSDQPAPNTTVFTVATLAPGASANFTSSLTVPANACSVTTTFSGQGKDICTPNMVTNTIPITCPITTAPAIAVTLACPAVPVTTGGLITYAGTVRNSGNVTLNNVAVVNNQASPSTVFTVASLAPGASANFTASFTAPANACSVTSAVTATGSDNCTETVVNNSASATCTLVTAPGITVTQNCPANPPSLGGVLTYSGTVSNAGNITLTNVVVTDDQTGANSVFTLAALAPGASSSFTGSYTVPASGCAVTSTLTANARDKCTGALVTASATATCPVQGASNIAVTLGCPDTPTPLGGLLTFSGTVRNAGTVTLTNVVVVRDAPAPNTSVFTVASLAPGASANFTGSYTVPGSNACSITTSVSASANDQCAGSGVIARATISCPLVSTPGIVVTQNCPVNPASPGGVFTYSGTVSNAGNNTLTNIVVLNHQPAANTVVFTQATLASGASTNFTASYTVPSGSVCSVTAVVTATANDICSGNAVTNSTTAACPLTMAPRVAVTLNCPEVPAAAGGLITCHGTVSNPGNVTLNNVVVVDSQSSPSTVLTVPSLAPGGSANFTASFTAPADACSVSSTVTASGSDNCAENVVNNSASATCTLVTTPRIAVMQNCPANPPSLGGVLTYSGTVSNAGNITLTNVVVTDDQTGANSVFTLAALAPGASSSFTGSYTVPASGCAVTSTLTANARDKCTGALVAANATATCLVQGASNIAVTLGCPDTPTPLGGLLTFSGTIRNAGTVTLTNVVVVRDAPAPNTSVFTVASLAPGASANFTGSYTVPGSNACSITTSASASANDQCAGSGVIARATISCPLVSTPGIVVTQNCPVNPASPGGVFTYSGTVSNAGNNTLTNIVVLNHQPAANTVVFTQATLASGASTNFTASYTVPSDSVCSVTSVVTATANDICSGNAVTNSTTATCPLTMAPRIAVTLNCPEVPAAAGGLITYHGTVSNPGNVTLNNVTVVDSQSAPSTVLTVPSLAPGGSANFTASFTAPANACSVSSTVTASGSDACVGTVVTGVASATCPISTAPAIAVTLACPAVPVAAGSLITYAGTVRNSGNVTLNNVAVVNNQASPSTVFTVASLAPGVSANFTASFTAPANACSVTSAVTATGSDNCTENVVNNSASATCTLVTAPGIAVAQNCPVSPASPGGLVTYSGSVSNTGNITLTNVVVSNSQSGSGTGGGGGGSVSTAGLVGYWAFDEASGSVAIDGSGLGNNGNIINATRVPGESGGALSFNGNAYVDLGNNASMNFSGAVTISAWINPQSVVAANDILSHGYSASPIQAVFMHIYQGRYEVGSQINNGTAFVAAAAVPAGDIGTFVHLAGVYDGSTWTLYRNGVAVATTPSGAVSTTVNANWAIGARGGGGSQLFNGVIDEVRLYQRALSAAEIGLLAGQTITPGPGPASTVFTAAILAPGAVANFTFSVTVPTNSGCAITSTLTGSGNDTCTGSPVTANVSSSCPLVTAPLITVTQTCPVNLVSAGGILTYSGTVSNAGNITLTNIVVTDNRPADNTVIFTAASLAPGASANFSGSYEVPINCCVVWSTATASGQDTCVGTTVTDTDTTTCTVLTMPSIVVTKTCPPTAAQPGDVLQYSGTVSNAGNITLVDVTIVNSQPGEGSPVFGPITLAPGESANYYASYLVPPDFCGTDTITAQGLDACTFAPVVNSVTTTCPILTTPRIAVTKNCPAQPTPRGGVFTFTGTVSNPGDVTLINVMVANNYQADCYLRTNGPVIGPITLAPGASVNFSGSYTAPLSCCEVMDTLTASGQDRCAGTRVMATATAICPLLSTPHITVTRVCPASPVPVGGVFAYSGSVSNAGDVVLTNVYVLSSKPNANTSVLGPMALAPGETEMFSGSYTVTANSDPTTDTVTASGTDICQGQTVTTTANCSGPVGPLIVSSVTLANGTATVTWMATPGVTYRLQCASNYQNSVWINVPGDVTAISNTVSKNEAVGTTPQRFYRVMVVK